jgi:L-threonylcarbamoyladenylate synthase
METLKILPKNKKEIIERTVKAIKQEKVVVCPTDTVYGLLARADSQEAVDRLFQIKKRNLKKPVPVLVKDIKMAQDLAIINTRQKKKLKKLWPGKITLVLKAKAKRFPKGILSQQRKIALRIPKYQFLNSLLEKASLPLTGTSANISGKKPSHRIEDIVKQFENKKQKPDLILDAAVLEKSLPSTVIDLTSGKIIRKGRVSKKEILEILK